MHRKEVTHSNGSYERKSCGRKLADEMGRAKKIPLVHYRVMHRKRVTSELHDSYFHLMTIKHSISKIKWVLNDYITQLSLTSQLNWVPVPVEFDAQGASGVASRVLASWRRDMVRKATSGRRGLWALMSWGLEKMLIRCNKESQHPAEWAPRPLVEHQRTRKTQRDGHKFGVKILQFMFGLQLPLTCNPWTTLSNPCNKVRGNILLKKSSCVFIIILASVIIIVSLWCCRWLYNTRFNLTYR